jgi:hypothetical protein
MTAVEWLQFMVKGMIENGGDLGEDFPALMNHIQQAEEIEKQQKIEFAKHCLNKALDTDIRTAYQDVEKYYNEIYGTSNGSTIS